MSGDPSADTTEVTTETTEGKDFLPYRPSLSAAIAFVALTGICVMLNGWVGLVPPFLLALVALGRLPRKILAGLGVAFLALVPVAVLASSKAGIDNIEQAYAYRSLLPNHLTFVGLVLTMIWVLLDLRPLLDHLRSRDPQPDLVEPLAHWPLASRLVVFGLMVGVTGVSIAAVWAL